MNKGFCTGLIIVLVLCLAVPSWAQQQAVSPLVDTLEDVERVLYGIPASGSVVQRVEDVERDLIGDTLSGTLMDRVDRLRTFVLTGTANEPSLEFKIQSVRLTLDSELGTRGILFAELEDLERAVFGYPAQGAMGVRVDNLFRTVVDPSRIDSFSVRVPEETLVKISIETTIHSERSNVGDPVPFRVIEDVVVDGVMVIDRGTRGEGRIDSLRRKGNFGRSGRMTIYFDTVPGVDGTPVPLELGSRAIQENKSLAYAVGASVAGLAIFGPIGLVAGFFVHGEPATVERGSELFVEVSEPVRVGGQLAHSPVMQPAFEEYYEEDPSDPDRYFPTQLDEEEDPGRWAEPVWGNGFDDEPYEVVEPTPGDYPEIEIEIRPYEDWGK